MGRHELPISDEQREQIATLWRAGTPLLRISKQLGLSRARLRTALKRANLLSDEGAPTEPALAEPLSESRVDLARTQLWRVLNDANSPGAAVVAAFNALAESEGWATARVTTIPAPLSEDEALARFLALFESYDESLQKRVVAALP